jgi:hypothetical protein
MRSVKALLPAAAAAILVTGCAGQGELDPTGGVTAVRSACPVVGVPAGTGDITLFNGNDRSVAAIDVAAIMTEVRGTCDEAGDQIVTTVSFRVDARRSDAGPARDVTLPYYIAVVRGGSAVSAKQVGAVGVHFDAGQLRASTTGQATATVSRAAATIPEAIRQRITARRKAGDEEAAVDPLSQPEVRNAVLSASFEALVGFQLTDEQLRYNAQR